MKTLQTFLSEKTLPINNVQDGKRKIVKVKNKVIINPDFNTYQARTHKDADTAVPLDNINTNGKATIQSTSSGTNY